MLNRKAMRELVCLIGTELTRKEGDMVDIQGNYSFFNKDSSICITITSRPEDRDDMPPHIWVKQMYGFDGFYFLFGKETNIRVQQINHPHTVYEAATGAEILAQWPTNASPDIRPYFVTILELYDKANPA